MVDSKFEEIFYCRSAIRIIFHLYLNGMDTITGLQRIVRVNHKQLSKTLNNLERSGVIQVKRLGRIRVYELNKKSPFFDKIRATWSIWSR